VIFAEQPEPLTSWSVRPGNRGLWRKANALNRQEFVVLGWSDPDGSRPRLGALLLGYYTDDDKLIYAGREGTGMPVKVLAV
jgi:ATP-dependent DNA ligase